MAKHRRETGPGRHRLGSPRLLACHDHAAVRARLTETRPPWYLALFRLHGRHTSVALVRSGARPRPAFALIMSL